MYSCALLELLIIMTVMNIVIGEFSWKKLKWLADVTVLLQVRDYKKDQSQIKKDQFDSVARICLDQSFF